MKTNRVHMSPPQPGYYVLRNTRGEVIDQGEEKVAEFCIRARELGWGASVEEIQHPTKPGTPFGFCFNVPQSVRP